jgi:hypothetical protein
VGFVWGLGFEGEDSGGRRAHCRSLGFASVGMTKGRVVAFPFGFDRADEEQQVPPLRSPDFLWNLVALMHFMHPSLRKGAHVDLSSAAWQEIRVRSGPTAGRDRRDDKGRWRRFHKKWLLDRRCFHHLQRKMRREMAKDTTSQVSNMAIWVVSCPRVRPCSMLPRKASMAAVSGRARTTG